MSKGLEALKILYPNKTNEPYYTRNERRYACSIIEKELKALEIIKNKRVDIAIFFEPNSSARHRIPLTQEEYNLLKEVLL